jgi:hypothetical protein
MQWITRAMVTLRIRLSFVLAGGGPVWADAMRCRMVIFSGKTERSKRTLTMPEFVADLLREHRNRGNCGTRS